MKNKIILIASLLLVFGCQRSNSSPADSGNSNGPKVAPPATSAPVQQSWQKKLESCPLQISKEMTLEQVAETASLMRQQCGFTPTEWTQVVQQL